MLAFARVLLSQGDRPLARETTASLEYALRGALSEQFPVRGMLRSDATSLGPVETVTTACRIDPIAHLPSLSIQTALPPSANPVAFYYKIPTPSGKKTSLLSTPTCRCGKRTCVSCCTCSVRTPLSFRTTSGTKLPTASSSGWQAERWRLDAPLLEGVPSDPGVRLGIG